MHLASRFYRKFIVLVVATLAISALAASPALAKGRTPQPTGGEKCGVSPTTVTNVLPYTIWGTGFPPGTLLDIYITDTAGTIGYLTPVTSEGWFALTDYANFNPPETQNVNVYNAMDRKMTVWCHFSFDVLQ